MGQPVTGLTASEAIAQAGSGAGDSIAQGQTVSAPMRVGSIPVIGSGQRWELRQIEQIDSVLAVIKLANDRSDGGRAAHGKRDPKTTPT
jgi:hypothetical protein